MVGLLAAFQGGAFLSGSEAGLSAWALGVLAIASAGSVLLGFLTPMAGTVAGVTTVLIALDAAAGDPAFRLERAAVLLVAADAAALVLLGPGAYSLDAFLFGRREIVIVHQAHTTPRPGTTTKP